MNVNYSASIIMILSNTVCPKFQVAIILLLLKKSVLRARINESWMLTDFFAIIFFFNILMLDRRLAVLHLVKCNISNTRSA